MTPLENESISKEGYDALVRMTLIHDVSCLYSEFRHLVKAWHPDIVGEGHIGDFRTLLETYRTLRKTLVNPVQNSFWISYPETTYCLHFPTQIEQQLGILLLYSGNDLIAVKIPKSVMDSTLASGKAIGLPSVAGHENPLYVILIQEKR